jgi:CsoR family transcriptional regulator, copper-sensing transcriptional repressor
MKTKTGHRHEATHDHKSHKSVSARLKRATGHLQAVDKMIEDYRSCADILQQLSAVIAALNGCRAILLTDHLESCLAPAVKAQDRHLVEELTQVVKQALKV